MLGGAQGLMLCFWILSHPQIPSAPFMSFFLPCILDTQWLFTSYAFPSTQSSRVYPLQLLEWPYPLLNAPLQLQPNFGLHEGIECPPTPPPASAICSFCCSHRVRATSWSSANGISVVTLVGLPPCL